MTNKSMVSTPEAAIFSKLAYYINTKNFNNTSKLPADVVALVAIVKADG
ncbi:hypothetical protein [Telmatospirillum sp.]|nr:hypothetical protein [Telmatospirillum sp.]MDR3440797.1 hypothetical protein [Telmatospirillum sp.]